MDKSKKELDHLKDCIPEEVLGFSSSMYTIALEGWRRGLTLKFVNKNKRRSLTDFILANENRIYRFSGSRGNIIPKETINLCANKLATKTLLNERGIAVPEGELFEKGIPDKRVIEYATKIGFPVVVKSYNGSSGEGVVLDIQNEKGLREALIYVRKTLEYPNIIIESFIPSIDYQLYIIGDKVAAAFERVAAHVIGDGQLNIKQLINQKNKLRRKNPGLRQFRIKKKGKTLLDLLQINGYTLDSIPSKGEKVLLSTKTNIAEGGDSFDVTDKLSNGMKELALKAVQEIPELQIAAVEMLVDPQSTKHYITEIKTQPSISGYLFPSNGRAQDLAKEIIDYYFPETNKNHSKPYYYFGADQIFKLFNKNKVQSYTVPSAPMKNTKTIRYDLKGVTNRIKFSRMLQTKILSLRLHGFIEYKKNKRLMLVVSGNSLSIDELVVYIKQLESFKGDDFVIKEEHWDYPIKVGFEVITNKKIVNSVNHN